MPVEEERANTTAKRYSSGRGCGFQQLPYSGGLFPTLSQRGEPTRTGARSFKYRPSRSLCRIAGADMRPRSTLERLATKLGSRASWKNARLFRRPKKEDRRGRREGDAQDRGRSHLRRGHLLRQALRGELP